MKSIKVQNTDSEYSESIRGGGRSIWKRLVFTLGAFFLTLGLAVDNYGYTQTLGTEASKKHDTTYHSTHGKYSVKVPENWEMQEQEIGQGVRGLEMQSPADGTADSFLENVNIIVIPAETTDLRLANTRMIQTLKQNLAEFIILDQGVGHIGQHLAAWFVHTFIYQGHTLKGLKCMLINGTEMYLVTCTALPSTFSKFKPIFWSLVASITFDEPTSPEAERAAP